MPNYSTAHSVPKASRERQIAAPKVWATPTRAKVSKTIYEVVSGSLPAQRRQNIVNLIEKGEAQTVFIESCRALARSVRVSDELYEKAKQHNVKIIPTDLPDLLKPDATHQQKTLYAGLSLQVQNWRGTC